MTEPSDTKTAPPAPRRPPNAGTASDQQPAAGPHARSDLTDEEKTPGAGTLPDTDENGVGDGASS